LCNYYYDTRFNVDEPMNDVDVHDLSKPFDDNRIIKSV